MPYNELRKDYLLNRWVIIATERSRRPTDFAKQKTETAQITVCPMCVGNEHLTPPAVMLYLKENDGINVTQDPLVGERPKNWLVRVIPNLYPAFSPPKQPEDIIQILKSECLGNAIGSHEVIVESPNHDEGPADAELPQLELVIHAYIDRLKELSAKSYIKYVSIFRNFGKEAGASLSHAHSQIIATPMVPSRVQEELDASKAYYKVALGNAFSATLLSEKRRVRDLSMKVMISWFSLLMQALTRWNFGLYPKNTPTTFLKCLALK